MKLNSFQGHNLVRCVGFKNLEAVMVRKFATRRTVIGVFTLLCAATTAQAQTAATAESFAIVGGQQVAANGVGSIVNGDVGISPAAATNITGFPGAAVILPPFSNHGNDGTAISAATSALTLFNSAAMAPAGGVVVLANMSTSGPTANGHYTPGKYSVPVGTAIIPTTITLDGAGTYIFSVNSDLTTSVGSTIILNGVDPCSVWWRVPTQATLNGVNFPGTVVSDALIAVGTGATVTGRLLTTANGSVTLAGGDSIGGCSAAAIPPVPPVVTLPPCPPSAGTPPTITPIGNQAVAVNGSASVNFTIGGGIITDALIVSVASSDGTLVPQSAMSITRGAGGARTLTIRGADGRTGLATITVTVTDPGGVTCSLSASTSFQFAIGAAVPTLPEWAMIALMAGLALAGVVAMRRRTA
jgi:hypothetical protein